MSNYIGDFALESTFDVKFCTVATTGAPTVLSGSPVISAYVDNSTTQLTAGITLTVDFDSIVGLNNVRVVATAANGYAAGGNYQLVITTGTVGGVSVVGYVVAQFSIQARSSLRPTVAGRTLDVSTGGEAGVDWANIGSPTTSQNLSGTALDAAAIRAALGLASANVDTQLAALSAFVDTEIAAILAAVDTEIAAIKAKTDSLTFTVANVVDANVQRINDVAIVGDGSATPFGV